MTISVSTQVLAQLQANGLSPSEAAGVLAAVQALPAYQWSAWIWSAPDYTALTSQSWATLWGNVCFETIVLIDTIEHGHWARPVFAQLAIQPT